MRGQPPPCPHGRYVTEGEHCDDCTNPTAALLAGIRTGDWLDAQHFAPLQWAVPDILPEGFTLFVGPPKVGKSWLLLSVLLGVACGGRALGLQVERRPVLYLALEDGDRRMQDRCRKLLAGEPIPQSFQYLTRIEALNLVPTVEAWMHSVGGGAPPLVVVDTLGKVKPPAQNGESAYQHDYRIGSTMKRLADDVPGSAVVVVHHDRKAESSDFVEKVSGTNGLAGAADSIVVLARARHETSGKLAVTGRDIAENELAVDYDPRSGTWTLEGGSVSAAANAAAVARASDGLGDDTAQVVRMAMEAPEGIRASDVALVMGWETNKSRTYLGRLVEGGRLVKLARGLYGPPPTPVASVALLRSGDPDGPAPTQNATLITLATGGMNQEDERKPCEECGEPMIVLRDGQTRHPGCEEF